MLRHLTRIMVDLKIQFRISDKVLYKTHPTFKRHL